MKTKLCKCGCGQLVTNDYARGHCHRRGFKHSEETKAKISKTSSIKRGFHHSEETKKRISEVKTGTKWSDETRRKMEVLIASKKKPPKEQKLCECGCGELASPGNRFLPSHHHRCRSEEVRKNMSESHKGQSAWNKGLTSKCDSRILSGELHPRGMKDKFHSEETKKKMSNSQTGLKRSNESKCNISNALYLAWKNPENKEKWSSSKRKEKHPMFGKKHRFETIHKMISTRNTKEHFEIMSHAKLEFYKTERGDEVRKIIGETTKNARLWERPDFISKMQKSRSIKPNKLELDFISFLNDLYPDQWKFVGDFSFWVNRKNPDFRHKNKRLLIELFGDYWHKSEDVKIRKDIFGKSGYKTLVIWESDFRQDLDSVKSSISRFMNN